MLSIFLQAAAPSCTELETIVLDWLGKMIGLPPQFLSRSPGSRGGGVIQTSASECVLDCLLAARAQAIRALKITMGDKVEETVLLSKLMAYCSKVKTLTGRVSTLQCERISNIPIKVFILISHHQSSQSS